MGRFGASYRVCWLALTAVVGLYTDPASSFELVDKIVAVVDGNPILYSDVQRKIKKGPLVLVSDFPSNPNSPDFERALNDRINLELILNKADELEIDISDEEVEAQIDQIIKQQGADRESLKRFLAQQSMSYETYKNDLQNQMLIRRFQGREILPRIKLTRQDLETYYLKKKGVNVESITLTLRQILIRIESNSSAVLKEEKQKLSAEIYQKLENGMEFEEAVKVYSDGPKARENGGLMQNIRLKDLQEDIRNALKDLDQGSFSEPIQTPLGYHIFYLERKKFSGEEEFEAERRKLEFELRTQETARQTRFWIEQARKRNKVDIISTQPN